MVGPVFKSILNNLDLLDYFVNSSVIGLELRGTCTSDLTDFSLSLLESSVKRLVLFLARSVDFLNKEVHFLVKRACYFLF